MYIMYEREKLKKVLSDFASPRMFVKTFLILMFGAVHKGLDFSEK